MSASTLENDANPKTLDTDPEQSPHRMWFLYILRCRGGQLYTGITTDISRRLAEHTTGKGAKYLRGKAPLALQYQQAIGSHSEALKAEIAMKKLSKHAKEHLIRQSIAS